MSSSIFDFFGGEGTADRAGGKKFSVFLGGIFCFIVVVVLVSLLKVGFGMKIFE